MRRRSVVFAFVTAGLLAAVVSAGSVPHAAGNAEPQPPPRSEYSLATSLPFEDDARSVGRFAEGSNALGQYYDEARAKYVVRVPSRGPGSDISTSATADLDVPVHLEPSTMSHAQLSAALKAIEEHSQQDARRKYTYAFFYDPAKDQIVLTSDAPRADAEQLLNQFPMVEYTQAPIGDESRLYDTAPHWGDASITNDENICTSGFTVQTSTGIRRMTTAGHCYYLSVGGAEFHSRGGGGTFGTIGVAPYPDRDIGWLGGSTYGAYIYVGGATGSQKHVDGAYNPPVGIRGYCVSGQTTFENCGLYVHSLNGTKCNAFGCTHNLVTYSPHVTASGDSGAPFYAYTGDGQHVHIRALHLSGGGGYGYAERWGTIAAYGYSIVT